MTTQAKELFSTTIAKLRAENLAGNTTALHVNKTAEIKIKAVLLEFAYELQQLPPDSFEAEELTPKELTEAQQKHMAEINFRTEREAAILAMDTERLKNKPAKRMNQPQPPGEDKPSEDQPSAPAESSDAAASELEPVA